MEPGTRELTIWDIGSVPFDQLPPELRAWVERLSVRPTAEELAANPITQELRELEEQAERVQAELSRVPCGLWELPDGSTGNA